MQTQQCQCFLSTCNMVGELVENDNRRNRLFLQWNFPQVKGVAISAAGTNGLWRFVHGSTIIAAKYVQLQPTYLLSFLHTDVQLLRSPERYISQHRYAMLSCMMGHLENFWVEKNLRLLDWPWSSPLTQNLWMLLKNKIEIFKIMKACLVVRHNNKLRHLAPSLPEKSTTTI